MARHRQARLIATMVAGVAVGGALSTAVEAQTTQRGQPKADTPRLIVVNFRSAEKQSGVAAANAVRDRLMREYSARDLWVIDKKNIDSFLEQSGYPTDEALSTVDAQQLARLARADEFVEGSVTPASGQYRVDGRVIMTLNPDLVQPLPSITVGKPGDAGAALARAVKEVRPSLESARECLNLARQQKYAEADAAAKKAMSEYANSTVARICQLGVMDAQKASPDQKLAVAQEILKIDPRSKPGLRTAYAAQDSLGQDDAKLNTLLRLVAVDPGNVVLQNQVVNELAANRQFDLADSVITSALAENPNDPQLMRTAFLVYLGAERYKKAIGVGEEMVQIDTAAADSAYFVRLARAYQGDSQPQKATEAISRGLAKFPNSSAMLVSAAQMYRSAGQLQQAAQTLTRALSMDPKTPQANLALAQIHGDMNQPDSALAALRAGMAAGDDKATAAGIAASLGQKAYQAASQSKSKDDYMTAIKYLQFSDQTNPQDPVKFMLGASAYTLGMALLQEAQQSKSCEPARLAKEQFPIVQMAIGGGGGKVDPKTAGEIMSNAQQYAPYADQMIQAFCK